MPESKRTSLLGPTLTAASVLISAAALLWSWQQDRRAVLRAQAQELRTVTADTIAALDRLESVSLLLFDEVQPDLVEASEVMGANLDKGPVQARDVLWRRINERKLNVLQSMVTPDVEDRIARLYAYHPEAYAAARRAVKAQRNVFEGTVARFLALTEQDVLTIGRDERSYQTAHLGNQLRTTTADCRAYFREKSTSALAALRSYLASLIAASDLRLLQRRLLPEASAVNGAQHTTAADDHTASRCGRS